jgi:uncharacterized protein YqeY
VSLKAALESGLKDAMRAGDRVAVSAIRLSLSEVKNVEIDKRRPLEDGEVVQVLRASLKKRHESIDLFRQGGRQDLVEKESAEAKVLERFLPAAMSAAELVALVDAAVAETGASAPRDMGKVMKVLVPRVAGRADGAEVSRLVKERLSGAGA